MSFAKIYLASQSPRRAELLTQIGVAFEVLHLRSDRARGMDVDETPLPQELAEAYVQRVCLDKARAAHAVLRYRSLPDAPVLAADTTVVLDGKIFGKPDSPAHAIEMLQSLSGREHQVLTAVALVQGDRIETGLSRSEVRFIQLDEARIRRYLMSSEGRDKAGAYAIQGLGGAFVAHLSGSYSGVVGLPLCETVALLRKFNLAAP
ncbi:MAG: nucleoside triphosphate pyrophosphatase [Gallionella sp.]